jgi:hypothetical protein
MVYISVAYTRLGFYGLILVDLSPQFDKVAFVCAHRIGGEEMNKEHRAIFWGIVIGFAIGAYFSYAVILPPDILNLKLVNMTIGDVLRIFAALVIAFIGAGTGWLVGLFVGVGKGEEK